MFSFDVSEIGILSTILLAAICLVCTVLVRQIPAIGWKHRAERDLNLLKKLEEEARTTKEIELVNIYKRRIFRSVEKGLYRPNKVRTKAEIVVKTFLGTVISIIEVLLCWGIPAVISGNFFENLYMWVVVLEPRGKYCFLITAFYVDKEYTYKSIMREAKRNGAKIAGSAC